MAGANPKTDSRGHAYIILNVLRGINITVLLAVMISSAIMMIFAKLPNGFQFFDDVTHFFVICVAGLLIFCELGVWQKGLEMIGTLGPVFANDGGFVWFGLTFFLLGCHLLGTLSSDVYTKKSVPKSVSQVIMASGVLAIAIGIINVIASFAFSSKQCDAHQMRSKGASDNKNPTAAYDGQSIGSYGSSMRKEYPTEKRKSAWANPFRKSKISSPITHDMEQGPVVEHYAPEELDSRSSPIAPGLARPPTALHPANRNSFYSEVSHLDRFDDNKI
ncbi:hypothetical protein GGR56DRAFT_370875 [Xylariaceae sp. FL0804]|nr:hypothetical protein GGR56DRAFT_370875 [Xylariaceae sp. FL0804]